MLAVAAPAGEVAFVVGKGGGHVSRQRGEVEFVIGGGRWLRSSLAGGDVAFVVAGGRSRSSSPARTSPSRQPATSGEFFFVAFAQKISPMT